MLISRKNLPICWVLALIIFLLLRIIISDVLTVATIFSVAIFVASFHYFIFPYLMDCPITLPTSAHVLEPESDKILRLLAVVLAVVFLILALFIG